MNFFAIFADHNLNGLCPDDFAHATAIWSNNMAYLGMNFDANSVAPATTFEVLPAGKYEVQIVQSEMKTTKDGHGSYLHLEMAILSGEHANRKLFDRLNLINNNQQAVEIAQRTLSAICHAIGVMNVDDSEKLHFKPMLVDVKVKPAGPDKQGVHREAQNEVKGYFPLNSAVQSRPTASAVRPAAAPAVQARATTPTVGPWNKAKQQATA